MEPKSESGSNWSADEVVLHVCHAGCRLLSAWRNIKVCVNSELRRRTVRATFLSYERSIKLTRLGRCPLQSGTTFFHINGVYDLCKCFKCFYVFFKNWPVNMNATFEIWPIISSFWTDFDRSGGTLNWALKHDVAETTSSVYVLLEICTNTVVSNQQPRVCFLHCEKLRVLIN